MPPATIEPPQNEGAEESDWTWPYRYDNEESEAPTPMPYADEVPCIEIITGAGVCRIPVGDELDFIRACETPADPNWIAKVLNYLRVCMNPLGIEISPETPDEQPSYYHHHYEGCPYMSGRYCPPAQSPVQLPRVEQQQEEQEMPVVEMPVVDETPAPRPHKKPARQLKKWYLEKLMKRISERQWFTVPFTDTMEFRPSDAGNYPLVNVNPF